MIGDKIGEDGSMIQNVVVPVVTEEQLDSLQWAKEFMERYERKQVSKKLG